MDHLRTRVLEAKEERSTFQKELIARHQLPIISLTLNLPGGFELYRDWKSVFEMAINAIESTYNHRIMDRHNRVGKWGPEAFWAIKESAIQVKEKAIELENKHPMGRIFDIDVLEESGRVLSRKDLLMEGRDCMVCHDSALFCYREKTHSYDDVKKSVEKIISKGLVANE